MTQQEIKKQYILECYGGDRAKYRADRKADYCKAQFKWTCWMDMKLKNGEITQKQFHKATF